MSSNKEQKKSEPFEFTNYLSFLDLERHPGWKEAWFGQDKEMFEKLLFSMGVDLDYGYEIRVTMHRSRICNRVEYGPRIDFRERTDDFWMRNMMQTEDVVRHTKSEIARVGMTLAMNNIHNVAEATQAKMMNNVSNVNIACKE